MSAAEPRLQLTFGSRETGEGEISDFSDASMGRAADGSLIFSHEGTALSGWLNSTHVWEAPARRPGGVDWMCR